MLFFDYCYRQEKKKTRQDTFFYLVNKKMVYNGGMRERIRISKKN